MSGSGGPSAPTVPPGTFRIDRDGAWRHEGQEITHPGVLRNLQANLRAEGGRHFLQVRPSRIDVEVEDTPFVVVRVENASAQPGGAPSLWLHLSDGSEEPLDPHAVWVDVRGTPYSRVKAGAFTARFAVAAWLQLAPHVEEEPATGGLALVVGDRRVPLTSRTR